MPLSSTQKVILNTLYQEHRPMSSREISDLSGVSWVTVKKNLPILKTKGFVIPSKEGERTFYKFNYSKIGEEE